jgi:hypothetical protein
LWNKVAPAVSWNHEIASMPYSTGIFNLVLLASLLIVVITSFHRCIVGAPGFGTFNMEQYDI